MWNVFASIISGFVLLRDLFGYLIPGAALLAILAYSGYGDAAHLPMSGEPIWVRIAVVIGASYGASHILAAIGYTLFEQVDRLQKQKKIEATGTPVGPIKDVVYYRYLYPSMFIEADRRDTLTLMRVCLAVALLFGAYFFPGRTLSIVSLVTGLFLLWNGYISKQKAESYRDATLAAAATQRQTRFRFFAGAPAVGQSLPAMGSKPGGG